MDTFTGQIILFAGNFAPRGFALCQGQLLSIRQYTALYVLLGRAYGGDGINTFGLPDLRGRAPVHVAASGTLGFSGAQAGSETVVLDSTMIPPHSHFANGVAAVGNTTSPSGAAWAEGPNPGGKAGMSPNVYTTGAGAVMASNALAAVGGGQGHPNLQPSLPMNYCICLSGPYPPRP